MPEDASIRETRKSAVWEQVRIEHPEFTPGHAVFDDPETVATLVLGDYIGFTPFPGAQVMDIGANAGILTAYWALNGANVTAYEADPVTYKLLTDMLAKNSLHVNAINAAVWTYAGEVIYSGHWMDCGGIQAGRNGSIQIPAHAGFTNNIGSEPDTISILCVSLAQAIGGIVWDAVKMDIEGAEFELLLATDHQVIRDHVRYMHLELHNGCATDDLYHKLMDKLASIFDLDIYPNPHEDHPWYGRTDWARCTNKILRSR